MITPILTYTQLAAAVLLIVFVLLQQQGQGLGGAIGGGTMEYSTRRGIQKWLLYGTIVAVVIFVGTSLARLVL